MSDAVKAIIGASAVILAAIIAGLFAMRGQNINQNIESTKIAFEMTKSVQRATPFETPTLPPAPTPTGLSSVANGYILYDDFIDPATLQKNWQVVDGSGLCKTFKVENSNLVFECTNQGSQDQQASLQINTFYKTTNGVAIRVRIDQSGGHFQLATGWKCSDGTQRAYHMTLSEKAAEAVLYYPLDPVQPWKPVLLAKPPVTAGEAHLLQIETTQDNIQFLLNGKILPINASTDFQPCLTITSISLDFFVWPGNTIRGQAESFSLKP
jgi:hypothetical protein